MNNFKDNFKEYKTKTQEITENLNLEFQDNEGNVNEKLIK